MYLKDLIDTVRQPRQQVARLVPDKGSGDRDERQAAHSRETTLKQNFYKEEFIGTLIK